MLYFKTEIMRIVGRQFGFALPTVLIASVIMLTVLATVVQIVGTTQNALNDQFYTKLAQAAGESGVAAANACAADSSSGGLAWTDAAPLKPNTDCKGTAIQSCPQGTTSQNCFVMPPQTMANAELSTTYSVGAPTETASGDALQISAVGETDLLRTSDGLPWRSYKQTVTQTLANSCSPTTADTQGWHQAAASVAYPSAPQSAWTGPTANVQPIQANPSTTTATDYVGPTWFRKNFNVLTSGTYVVDAMVDDRLIVYVDGQQVLDSIDSDDSKAWNTMYTANITLSAGCHDVVIESLNIGAISNATDTTATITKSGSSTPLVATDTTWRAYTPTVVTMGQPNYFEDPNAWPAVATYGYNSSGTNWAAVASMASYAEWVGLPSDGGVGNAPAGGYAFFLDNHTFTTTAGSTGIHINTNCDDLCYVYVDGQQVGTGLDAWSTTQTIATTVGPGTHRISVVLGNNGAGNSGFLLYATRDDTGAAISYSDHNWTTQNAWGTGVVGGSMGYTGGPWSYALDWAPPGLHNKVTNLVSANPSFETKNSSGAPTCTTAGWSGTNATISSVTTWASPTSWDPASSSDASTATQGCSLKIVPNGSGSGDTFAVIPGSTSLAANSTYQVSATIHIPAKLTGTLYNSDNRYIGIAVIWNNAIQELATAPNAPGTYHLSAGVKIPTGATGINMRLYNGSQSASDVVYWDNVMLTEGRLSYPFADGDSDDDSCHSSWNWTGTVGSSTSTGMIDPTCWDYQG